MLLFDLPVSGNCYKVRLLLAHLGIGYDRREVRVGPSGRDELLGDLSPALTVPTLVLDDGRPLAESGAILLHLAEGTPLLPTDPYERAQTLQWLFFEQSSVLPNIALVRFFVSISDTPAPEADLAVRRNRGRAALDVMERHLGSREFFAADRFTVADVALYAYTHVAHEGGYDLEPYAAVRAWLDRVASQPGHVPMYP